MRRNWRNYQTKLDDKRRLKEGRSREENNTKRQRER